MAMASSFIVGSSVPFLASTGHGLEARATVRLWRSCGRAVLDVLRHVERLAVLARRQLVGLVVLEEALGALVDEERLAHAVVGLIHVDVVLREVLAHALERVVDDLVAVHGVVAAQRALGA